MLILLSPAKRMDFKSIPHTKKQTFPVFLKESSQLVNMMKKYNPDQLKDLMEVSDELAGINFDRFRDWNNKSKQQFKQAVFAFNGDVYIGLDAKSFEEDDLDFAQGHLRILSGLYGVLKPLDMIQPYRLEMGTTLKNSKGNDLYSFWGKKVTDSLKSDPAMLHDGIIINLASQEYSNVISKEKINGKIYTPMFKDFHNGRYKIMQFFTKKARGMMANFIIKNKINEPAQIKLFTGNGYVYNEKLSGEFEWVFTRG